MTRLLVSVRNTAEAADALEAGAHLIDVKEPRRGSLGPADVSTIQSACSLIAGRAPVSAALGELLHEPRSETIARARCVNYAKLGMAGCADVADWQATWASVLDDFPATTSSVAVTYADWRVAHAPHPWRVLRSALKLGCRGMLVDTFDKSRGGLLDHLQLGELAGLVSALRASGLIVVLAGSLSRESVPRVLSLAPDYIAVRGAACAGGRQGRIDGSRIRDLLHLLGPGERLSSIGPASARMDCGSFESNDPPTRLSLGESRRTAPLPRSPARRD